MAMTVMAAAAAVSAGVGIMSALNAPSAPTIAPPPPPAGAYEYDEEGNATTIQVWDEEKNAYVTKRYPEPEKESGETEEEFNARHQKWEEDKAERAVDTAARNELREKMLANLDQTPEDRIKAYDEYAANMSTAMHKEVDEQYAKRVTNEDEKMAARGMLGSKAYVDTLAELRDEKGELDTDIALKADLAKEELGKADREFWLNTLGQIDAGQRADYLASLQESGLANQKATQATSGLAAMYNIGTNNQLNQWKTETEANRANTAMFTDTASGLAFLYGYNKGGGLAKTGGRVNTTGNYGFA